MKRAILHRRIHTFGNVLTLAAYADSEGALDLLGLIPAPPGDKRRTPDMELFFLGGNAAVRGRIGDPGDGEEIFRTPTVSVFSRGDSHFAYWHGKAESVFDRSRNRAVVVMPGARMYHPDFVSRSVCRTVIDRMLWEAGCLPLHAAAVACPDGCLLIGNTGSGKTTLLRGLLEQGVAFRADDRALVREHDGLLVYPEHIRFAVSEHRRKHSAAPPMGAPSPVPVRRILFLERSAGETRIDSLGCAESVARMIPAVSPYLEKTEWDAACGRVKRLVCAAECSIVRGWGDPGERVRMVLALMGKDARREI